MSISAIVMLIVAILIIWGGLGLGLIWVALIIFTVDALRASRSYRASALSDPETGMIPLVQAENVQAEDAQILLEEQEQTQRSENK